MLATDAATVMSAAVAGLAGRCLAGAGGGEGGKFLGQLLRAAMRTFGIFPVGRADEDFAVPLAGFAMKFIDWHEQKLFLCVKKSSPVFEREEICMKSFVWRKNQDFGNQALMARST